MAKERCRLCGKKVRVQIQKNTGYCSQKHQEMADSFCPTCKESMPCTTCGNGL